jgi:hypothetical protein
MLPKGQDFAPALARRDNGAGRFPVREHPDVHVSQVRARKPRDHRCRRGRLRRPSGDPRDADRAEAPEAIRGRHSRCARLRPAGTRARAWASAWTAKLASPTKTILRPGSQRQSCSMPCRARSVRRLCLRPAFASARSDGASSVSTGSALIRFAQGIGASTMKLSQRRPLVLTKCPWLERTGSRQMPRAAMRPPQRRSMVSSTPMITGPAAPAR